MESVFGCAFFGIKQIFLKFCVFDLFLTILIGLRCFEIFFFLRNILLFLLFQKLFSGLGSDMFSVLVLGGLKSRLFHGNLVDLKVSQIVLNKERIAGHL